MDLLENVSVAKDLISTINDVWKKSRQTANDDGKEFHDKISNTIKETCNSFQKKYLIADEYKDLMSNPETWHSLVQDSVRTVPLGNVCLPFRKAAGIPCRRQAGL